MKLLFRSFIAFACGAWLALAPTAITQGEAPFPTWRKRLYAQINSHKLWPPGAAGREDGGIVLVKFMIDRAGRLLSTEVAKSSGIEVFDTEAVDTINRSAPFEAAPRDLLGATITFIVPINFHGPRSAKIDQ